VTIQITDIVFVYSLKLITFNWKCWHMHTSVTANRGCTYSGINSVVALVKLVDWWYWYCRQQSFVVKAEWLLNRCLRRMYQRNKHGGRNLTSLIFQVTCCAALIFSRLVFIYFWKHLKKLILFDNKEISGIFYMLHNPCFISHKGADYFIILSSFSFQIICFV